MCGFSVGFGFCFGVFCGDFLVLLFWVVGYLVTLSSEFVAWLVDVVAGGGTLCCFCLVCWLG